MPTVRKTIYREDHFDRRISLTNAQTEGGTGWTFHENGAAGTPTCATIDSNAGELVLTLTNTNEAQQAALYMGDVLPIDIDAIDFIEWTAKVASISNTTVLVLGLADNRADDEDTIATSAWFKIEGPTNTSNLVVESDDGTNEQTDVATNQTLSTSLKRMKIDFTYGTDDVRFYVEDSNGDMVRVASTTTFDMSSYTGQLQPFVQLTKTASTSTPSVTIAQYRVQHKTAY